MKTPRLRMLLAPFAVLVPVTALYAIDITSPPLVDTFTAPPWPTVSGDPATGVTADWTTVSVGAGTDAAILDAAGFDAKIIAAAEADATLITTPLGSSSTIAPSTNGIARFNTGASAGGTTFLQTRPTGVDYLLLLAHLTNATGADLSSIKLTCDYSKATDTATETVKGLRAFWSITGAPGSWAPITDLSIDPGAAATYAAPVPVSATIPLGVTLPAGGTMFILWADQNSSGTDASYHIDNFSAGPGVNCAITGTVANATRGTGADPANDADDLVTFTANVTGTGDIAAAGWVVTAPAAIAGQTGLYGTDTLVTAPISSFTNGRLQVTVADTATAVCTNVLNVTTTSVIGVNTAGNLPILSAAPVAAPWIVDDATRVSRQTASTQADHVIDSAIIDLSGLGAVALSADLDAIAGASSGFEAADSFTIQVIVDGGAPVSILGSSDRDQNGRLAYVAGPPEFLELPNTVDTTLNYSFTHLIPAAASSLQIRIIGNSNSAAETYVVKNVSLSPAVPSLFAIPAGPPAVNNKNTDIATDDEFSGPVSITPIDLGASTGWQSDEAVAHTGLYADPNPVIFGPYLISDGPKTVILTDDLAVPAISSQPIVISPPVPVLTVTAPANITRNENLPGPADDTVTFDVTITGALGGPRWTATGGTPASGNFGPVTFTVPAGAGMVSGAVIVSDVSYPTATQTVTAAFPTFIYAIGQKDLGAGLSDVYSLLVTPPDNAWVNDAAARTLTMNNGTAAAAGVKTITSEPINLSAVGDASFSAVLETRDTSAGFEIEDTFVAELILDDGAGGITTVNLILPNDTDGSLVLEDAELSDGAGTVAAPNIRNIPLSSPIPANITSATLVIRGINNSANEFTIVRDVLFSPGTVVVDTDGDGVSDASEAIMGTSATDASDVLRLSQSAGDPNQITFPTKAGRFYRVYVSDDADDASHLRKWNDTGLATIVGNDATASFVVTTAAGEARRFYRLHVMTMDGTTGAGDWPPTVP